ncbi:MAG: FtsX-like permease family protein [Bacteroidales bacterium]|jgi:ABC-type lipoprotein release transport system permease subunit|nr:FtsX-like permease family protein [Bacteroidales bacterium]
MKLAFQLAYKNLMGAGLRTWLNAGVLSFAFVVIIFYNGLIDGWNEQAKIDGINWEWGNGHLLNENYDPYDAFSIEDGHGKLTADKQENLTPVLIRQAHIYPSGRMMPIRLKGIDSDQKILRLPTEILRQSKADFPVLIGKQMAESAKVKTGDEVLLRWRDKNGTYDAATVTIAGIFETTVPFVDGGQFWMAIDKLREITLLTNQTTYFIANEYYKPAEVDGWKFENQKYLMREQTKLINSKKIGGSILYIVLMTLGLLAIFDTQVLSIFRRQKEIGTYIALGMTRWQVVRVFTAEGSMYSVFAVILGAVYGIPILWYLSKIGISFGTDGSEMGIIMAERMYPIYGLGLIFGTIVIVILSATVVSFLPARKIARMNPVEALKGKVQ